MNMLLVLRSAEDMHAAVKSVNDSPTCRRRRVPKPHDPMPHDAHRILGIWLRHRLGANPPAWAKTGHVLIVQADSDDACTLTETITGDLERSVAPR